MKKLLLLLALAANLDAELGISVNQQPTFLQPSAAVGIFQASDTVTYALNMVTPTVRSAVIDTAGWVGVGIHLTASAGALINMEWAPTNTAALFQRSWQLSQTGPANFGTRGRYLRFTSVQGTGGLTYTTASLSYLPIMPPTLTVSGGSITVAGTVAVNGSVNMGSVSGNAQSFLQNLSNVARLEPSFLMPNSTAFQLTTAGLAVSVSGVAGTDKGPFKVYLSTFGPSGFVWDYGTNLTVPAIVSSGFCCYALAQSQTAQVDPNVSQYQNIHFGLPAGSTQAITVFMGVGKPVTATAQAY